MYNYHRCKGAYFITDGGMPKCNIFIDPIKNPCTKKETYWSEWLESVRKDVECAIGNIKTRFRFLWFMIFYHDYHTIEHAFKSACIIHNMLLIHDGLDISQWNLKDRWLTHDIQSDEEEDNEDVNIGMRLFSCSNVKNFFLNIVFKHYVQNLCTLSSNTFLRVFEHFLKSVRTLKKKCSNTKKKVFEH
jgi:hypothetical protein